MEGAAEASFERYELATYQAYKAATFSALAQNGKLKSLSSYMPKKADKGRSSSAAQAVAFFHRMKAAGLGVEISRVSADG